MDPTELSLVQSGISGLEAWRSIGRVSALGASSLKVTGLTSDARLGDRVRIVCRDGTVSGGEIVGVDLAAATIMPDGAVQPARLGDAAELLGPAMIAPSDDWIGRVIDPFGRPLDGRPLMPGALPRSFRAPPPPPASRRGFGARVSTGSAIFDTMLPLARGQRIGLFAGSGVGKSNLLGRFAQHVDCDVAVIALIGERGREVQEFVRHVLGDAGLSRSIVIAATSDQPAPLRRRCAHAAMAVAEHFRDVGQHVLLLADSVTRFAEAHREMALASGEPPSLRGYPPSVAHEIMALAERAGPGSGGGGSGGGGSGGGGAGDITAVFSVLVAGSDMEEPVADILRGVLDGHVVMDRRIAERGRFPAIDLLRSVSRSLPQAATPPENEMIGRARRLLGAYDRSEMMIQAGLYVPGTDRMTDAAIRVFHALDAFVGEAALDGIEGSFARLAQILAAAGEQEPVA